MTEQVVHAGCRNVHHTLGWLSAAGYSAAIPVEMNAFLASDVP